MEPERHFRGTEFPVAAPHQHRQDRRGALFGVRRRADVQHRPILRTRPREGRQDYRAGELKRESGPRISAYAQSNLDRQGYASSTTVLRRTPICGAATSTTSPGLSHTDGLRCTPAPVGVPVQIKSPGLSVAKVLM